MTGTPNLFISILHIRVRLFGHQENAEHFVDPSYTTSINLGNVDGTNLEELFPYYSVLTLLAGRDTDTIWFEFSTDPSVTEDIIWRSWFLNEPWLVLCELLHVLDSLLHVPDLHLETNKTQAYLIRIDHQFYSVVANDATGDSQLPAVIIDVTANLHLEILEAFLDGLLQ